MKSELMAAIYDKALKRKDLSGVVNKDLEKEKADEREANAKKDDKVKDAKTKAKEKKDKKEKDKKDREKADDPKAGADIGKIVNLMSGDANRVRSLALYCELGFADVLGSVCRLAL
jgi:sRNA-binding protein